MLVETFLHLKKIGLDEKSLMDMSNIIGIYFLSNSLNSEHFFSDLHSIAISSEDEKEFDERWRRLNAARDLRRQALVAPRDALLIYSKETITISPVEPRKD